MNPRQRRGVLLILVTVLGAVVTFVAMFSYVQSISSQVGPMTTVLKLSQQVTELKEVTAADVVTEQVPKRWVPDDSMSDKNGKIIEITFTQKTSGDITWNTTNGPVKGNGDATGSGSASSTDKQTHVTTTNLKVADENRPIVNEWLSKAYVTDPHSGTTTLTIPPNVLNPDSPVSGDPMQQLLYEQAISTDSIYNVDGNDISIGGEIALGLKIGGEINVGDEESKIKQQTYLSSPPSSGSNRSRKAVEWCTN